MIYSIPSEELMRMLIAANEMGARSVIEALRLEKKQIRQKEAIQQFGEKRITEWRRSGKITPIKQGRAVYYDKAKLDQLSLMNNLIHGVDRKNRAKNDDSV